MAIERVKRTYQDIVSRVSHRVAPTIATVLYFAPLESEKMGGGLKITDLLGPHIDKDTEALVRQAGNTTNLLGIALNSLRARLAQEFATSDRFDNSLFLPNSPLMAVSAGLELARLPYFDRNTRPQISNEKQGKQVAEIRCREHPIATVPGSLLVNLETIVRGERIGDAPLADYVTFALSMFANFRRIPIALEYQEELVNQAMQMHNLIRRYREGAEVMPIWRKYSNFGLWYLAQAGGVLASMSRVKRNQIETFIQAQDWSAKQKKMASAEVRNLTQKIDGMRVQLRSALFGNRKDPAFLDVLDKALQLNPNQALFIEFLGIRTRGQLVDAYARTMQLYSDNQHPAYLHFANALYEMAVDAGQPTVSDYTDSVFFYWGKAVEEVTDPNMLIDKTRQIVKSGLRTVLLTSEQLPQLANAGVSAVEISSHPHQKGIYLVTLQLNDTDDSHELTVAINLRENSHSISVLKDPDDTGNDYAVLVNSAMNLSYLAVNYVLLQSQVSASGSTTTPQRLSKGERRRAEERRSTIRQQVRERRRGTADTISNGDPSENTSVLHVILTGGLHQLVAGFDPVVQRRIERSIERFNERGTDFGLASLVARKPGDYQGPTRYRIRSGKKYRIILEDVSSKPGLRKFQIVAIIPRSEGYDKIYYL